MTYDPNRPPQPPQGQQPYGQPVFGQPGYGQPPYGQPPYPPGYAPIGYAIPQPTRPTSVIVVAIIGIVFSSIALLCMPIALLRIFRPDIFPQGGGTGDPLAMAMKDNTAVYVWMIISNVLSLLLTLLLLIGSIGAVRFRPWGRSLSIAYALIQLVCIVIGGIVQFALVLPAMSNAMATDAQTRQVIVGSTIAFAIFGMALGSILPILILILYRRRAAVEAFARGGR